MIHEEFHLKEYLHILRRRRDIVVLFFVTTVLVVTIGSFIMRPVYRATATLLIDVESPNVLTTSGAVSLENQNYFSYKEYYQSQIEIITSETIARKVFDEFKLGSTREYRKAKEPIKKFLKTVKVEPVRDTRLLKLHVENRNAELAEQLANRIAEMYVRRNLSYISKNEMLNLLKNEYLKLETKLNEYSKVYKDDHPEMIRLKKEMAELIDKIEREKKSAITYDIGGEDEKSEYRHALEGLKANNISILTLAEKPVIPVKPKKLLNFVIAVIVGFFGGVGLAFFFEYLDDTVKDFDDVERLAKWPFLGNVPKIDADKKMSEFEKDLFVNTNPKDPIAEAYRSIRTSVVFSSTDEHPLKAVLITSPGPQEGKTTTLCNLGAALAQSAKRVLLVDADMRKPRLHEVFRKENKAGLSNFLTGQAKLDDIVQKTHIDSLFLVTGGAHPPNPSELLAGHKMADFLNAATAKFDIVLFDSPPIAMLTDAAILSRVVDGMIMVIETGKTSRKALSRIYRLLQDTKAHIVGIILNKISLTRDDYYYYSYYYDKPK